jgi:hypothetical protein
MLTYSTVLLHNALKPNPCQGKHRLHLDRVVIQPSKDPLRNIQHATGSAAPSLLHRPSSSLACFCTPELASTAMNIPQNDLPLNRLRDGKHC